MGTATGLSAQRMLEIEQASVTGGAIDANGHLILEQKSGATIDAGQAKGETGSPGGVGPPGPPAPDSGFVTNLTITSGQSAWSRTNFIGRKIGGLTIVDGTMTYLAGNPTITADGSGNIADINNLILLPVGWQSSSGINTMVAFVQSGIATWWGRLAAAGGNVDLTHASYPGQKLTGGDALFVHLIYWSN